MQLPNLNEAISSISTVLGYVKGQYEVTKQFRDILINENQIIFNNLSNLRVYPKIVDGVLKICEITTSLNLHMAGIGVGLTVDPFEGLLSGSYPTEVDRIIASMSN